MKSKCVWSFVRYFQVPFHGVVPICVPTCFLITLLKKVLSSFGTSANVMSMKWYLSVVLICMYLVMCEVEHLHS